MCDTNAVIAICRLSRIASGVLNSSGWYRVFRLAKFASSWPVACLLGRFTSGHFEAKCPLMLQLKHLIFGRSLTFGCNGMSSFLLSGECGFRALLYPGPSLLRDLAAGCLPGCLPLPPLICLDGLVEVLDGRDVVTPRYPALTWLFKYSWCSLLDWRALAIHVIFQLSSEALS